MVIPMARTLLFGTDPRPGRLFLPQVLLLAALILLAAGCEKEVTLVDPGPFFSYREENAWPSTCTGPRAAGGAPPAAVPPPSGLLIEACPNPAPPGTTEITFHFRLEVRRPSVNLGIVNDRGLIVARLLEDYSASADVDVEAKWLLDGVEPGDYRAYFLADDIESSGDLRVE
jgi:hypothetical protein